MTRWQRFTVMIMLSKKLAAWVLLCALTLGMAGCAPEQQVATEPDETEIGWSGMELGNENVRNILMIGNSLCFYFCDELYEIAKADGIELVVANLYKSGGSLMQHVEAKEELLHTYKYIIHDKNGKQVTDDCFMHSALEDKPWDVITLQQNYPPEKAVDLKTVTLMSNSFAKKLYDQLKKEYPNAIFMWHQTWAKQVGYKGDPTAENKANNYANVPEEKQVLTAEKQTLNYEVIRDSSNLICAENGVALIPTGDAWQLARVDTRIGDVLCNRPDGGDGTHDGDIGGGQYLNACVWYEVLLKKSCVGNTFRPDYALSEEKILVLQQIAHDAVAALYGEDYAK